MRRAALLGTLVLACAHGGGAAPGGAGGPIELKFGWRDGFQSHVLVAHESRRTAAEPTGLVARERIVAEKRGDELWVFTRDIAARGNEPDLDTTVKVNEALVQVVGTDGKYRRAEGVDQALAAIKDASAAEREGTRQALLRSTAFDWEVLVGAWAGEKLAPGETRHKRLRAYVPELVAVETVLDVEYGLEGRVPCTDEETERRCVELSYRARLAPDERAATLERVRKVASSEQSDEKERATPEDVHADVEVLLVAEPGTLVPHRMSQRERLRLRLAFPDGRVVETERRSEDSYVFSERELRPPQEERGGPGPRDV